MTVTRKEGNSGKICTVCKTWKMLFEFPLDKKPGRFKGFRQNCCNECTTYLKEQAKKSK